MLDAYEIDIDNRIVSTSHLNLTAANLASSPALAALQTGAGLYGNFSPFGVTGGFYYARFSQKF